MKDSKPDTKKHWTDNVRINKRFLQTMRSLNRGVFTNEDGYVMYGAYHAVDAKRFRYDPDKVEPPKVKEVPASQDSWLRMNVRNQFCKWEHEGIVRRIRPGVYRWVQHG